jgi:zinc protease
VGAVTLDEVARASAVLRPDRLVWVIAGDRAKIEAGLSQLGLGPIKIIDADGNVQR